jgi:1-deoxy-D-xylulose-5-phosphate reductoisomerase
MRRVAVLGSTGSIGVTALAVLRRHPERFRVTALTGGNNRELLQEQVAEFRPAFAGLAGGDATGHDGTGTGPGCLVEAATRPDVDVVLNAVVGFAGLDATVAALRAGKRVALANKESLVVGGPLVLEAARQGGGELVPVDSEHSAVLQCLGASGSPAARLTLTASGGPFRTWPAERVREATVAEALRHPTWQMGHKITVDSATLVNKALEVIEAHFLFGLGYDRLRVVVHPQSIVHALVEFEDGSTVAQMGLPSMELPILYALTYPERADDAVIPRYDPAAAGPLTFEPVREELFHAFTVGLEAGRQGGTAPAVFNAANEEAVAAFLQGGMAFGRIADVVESVCESHRGTAITSIDAVRDADRWARRRAREILG